MLKVLGRGSNKKPKFPRLCQRPPAMCNEPRNMQTVCAMCWGCAVRWRAEYAECALKEEMMWLRTRDSHRAQFPCHGAQPGKGQPGHGIVWYLMELCGIVCYCVESYGIAWYCIPTGAQFPFPGAQASKGQPGHGRERDFRCHCRSVHCIVHRTVCTYIVLSAVWVQTPNPNCAWSSIIVGCGFYHVLCDPRTYRYTVHLRVRLLMDQLYPGSWLPLHRPHPLLCLPGSSRVVGASNLNAFCPFLQERRVRAKSWIF